MRNQKMNPNSILESLVKGRFAEKMFAQRSISNGLHQEDKEILKKLIISYLLGFYHPENDTIYENQNVGVRCWLMGALSFLPDEGKEVPDVLIKFMDPEFEPSYWVRYWAMNSLYKTWPDKLFEQSKKLFHKETQILPHTVLLVVKEENEDPEAQKKLSGILNKSNFWKGYDDQMWAILRAGRFIKIHSIYDKVLKLVDTSDDYNLVYEGIGFLENCEPKTKRSETAGNILIKKITYIRNYSAWDSSRIKAIECLGTLQSEFSTPLLLEELADFNPSISEAAAISLENILGIEVLVSRIVQFLEVNGDRAIKRIARGLRVLWKEEEATVALAHIIASNSGSKRDYAQRLLNEMGGVYANEKLLQLSNSTEQYLEVLKSTDVNLSNLFQKTIDHARFSFMLITGMNILIFLMGLVLISITCHLVLFSDKPLENWNTYILGAGGILGTFYGAFISKPGEKIKENVEYLTHYKMLFLGYLRQLRQTDQAFTKEIIINVKMDTDQLKKYNDLIVETMDKAYIHFNKKRMDKETESKESDSLQKNENTSNGNGEVISPVIEKS